MKNNFWNYPMAFTGLRMKPAQFLLIPLLFVLLQIGTAPNVLSQPGRNQQANERWDNDSPYGRLFDTKTMATVTGEVLEMKQIFMTDKKVQCTHLLLLTKNDTLNVHLGPMWYVDQQDLKIKVNDTLEITGSQVTYEGHPVLVASRIVRGKESMNFRNSDGYPFWSRWAGPVNQ